MLFNVVVVCCKPCLQWLFQHGPHVIGRRAGDDGWSPAAASVDVSDVHFVIDWTKREVLESGYALLHDTATHPTFVAKLGADGSRGPWTQMEHAQRYSLASPCAFSVGGGLHFQVRCTPIPLALMLSIVE
jgi:hypothetical protein